MKTTYPKFKRGEAEKVYSSLSSDEKRFIDDYILYRQARGTGDLKAKDLRRYIIQVRHILEIPFNEFKEMKDHTRLVFIIKKSYYSNDVKNNLLIDLNNLWMYVHPELWIHNPSFKELYIKGKNGHAQEEGHRFGSNIITDKEVELMLILEKALFWKTFLLVEDITGGRIKESRHLRNEAITFNDDGTSTIEIFMSKTGKPKIVFADKQTTDYIKRLQETQKNTNDFGKYLFHSPGKPDTPIHKNAVNKWFKELSIKATGKHHKPYELRHKKATKLYNLSKEGKISEFTALRLMGHSRSMRDRYDNTPKKEEIEILKAQAFKEELTPDKENELMNRINDLTKKVEFLMNLRKVESEEAIKVKDSP